MGHLPGKRGTSASNRLGTLPTSLASRLHPDGAAGHPPLPSKERKTADLCRRGTAAFGMAGGQRHSGMAAMRCAVGPVESHLIATLNLPLNLEQNSRCGFHAVLSQLRRDAKRLAWELPILRS
jgi:hypothetical protein